MQIAVILLDNVDLLHGHRVEADGVFQHAVVVKQGDAHGHHVFVGVVDGLGGGDLLLLTDDLRRDAGGEHTGGLQIKGRLAHDGIVGEAKVLLIVFADPENDAVGIGEHHIICQDQVVFGVDDVQQALEVDVIVKDLGQRSGIGHGVPPSKKIYSFVIITYSKTNRKGNWWNFPG